MSKDAQFTIYPLTADRWDDFERLFGENGACGGCWCMWWRQTGSQFEHMKYEQNKQAMHSLVESNRRPGLIAYMNGDPVGWCAVEPRENYPRLSRSRTLKKVDDVPVWSVVCFYIHKAWRKQGLMTRLLRQAIGYVHEQGGQVVEGYPIIPKKDSVPGMYAFTGLVSAFRELGFVEVARRSEYRPIMRYTIS
ncbi:MAG TPA: GNAT family N-acetyltransferase [bacterium]|nr:GNAT family N-acetyltransferase [bacterium]